MPPKGEMRTSATISPGPSEEVIKGGWYRPGDLLGHPAWSGHLVSLSGPPVGGLERELPRERPGLFCCKAEVAFGTGQRRLSAVSECHRRRRLPRGVGVGVRGESTLSPAGRGLARARVLGSDGEQGRSHIQKLISLNAVSQELKGRFQVTSTPKTILKRGRRRRRRSPTGFRLMLE